MILALSKDVSWTTAISNTCLGMGTVFLVLIFIMLVISAFALFSFAGSKPKKKAKTADIKPVVVKKKAVQTPVDTSSDLMKNEELVAVITAAIYAASGNQTASKDKLVVRSIRRAR